MKRYFAWIDLETTGLNPEKGYILEVACVITDTSLKTLKSFNQVVCPPWWVRTFPRYYMDEKVLQMHTQNKLLDVVPKGRPIQEVEKNFTEFLRPFKNRKGPQELYFTGNSIGSLDLPFIRKHMPSVTEMVHYRTLDISGLRIGLEQIFNASFFTEQEGASNHRALNDVYRCIQQLKYYKHRVQDLYEDNVRREHGTII